MAVSLVKKRREAALFKGSPVQGEAFKFVRLRRC